MKSSITSTPKAPSAQAFDVARFDQFSSLAEAFFFHAEQNPNGVCYRQATIDLSRAAVAADGKTRTWPETHNDTPLERILKLAAYLEQIGVQKGDRVMILSNTRPAWSEAEFAVYAVGGIVVTGYTDHDFGGVGYAIHDSGAKVVIVENIEQLEKVQAAMTTPFRIPPSEKHAESQRTVDVRKFITLEAEGVPVSDSVEVLNRILSGEAVPGIDLATGPKNKVQLNRHDPATIVYTSGTSGAPKGVLATHGQHLANIRQILESGFFNLDSRFYHALPFAHAFGLRMGHITMLTPVEGRFPAIVDNRSSKRTKEVMKSRVQDALASNADIIPVVPKLLEGVKDKVTAAVAAAGVKGKIALAVLGVYTEHFEAKYDQRSASLWNRVAHTLLELSGVGPFIQRQARKHFVAPDFRGLISGGAKLPKHLAAFYWAAGVPVYEGYGATEANTPVTLNRPGATKLGSAGQTLSKDVEMRIAPDGELLIRGPSIAREYFGFPEATAKTFKDGWYHTRDSATIDADGYLYIHCRIDDVEVPESGENINAADLEQKLGAIPLIEHVVYHAHQRPYPIALVSLRHSELKRIAPHLADNGSAADSDEVRKLVMEQIASTFNSKIAKPFERIKKIAVIENLDVGKGLTPSMKVERKKLKLQYAATIEKLYSEE